MFEWKVEELKLWRENKACGDNHRLFSCEHTTSREDKIAFIDTMTDDRLSYFLELKDKFDKDKPNLPKDTWGSVKTVSLKAWLKKNDTRHIVYTTYNYGEVHICGTTTNIQSSSPFPYSMHNDLVDKLFHRQLLECAKLEYEYFKTHDDYEKLKVLLTEMVEKHNTTFGVQLLISSDEISVGDYENSRPITNEEIKELLNCFEQLENCISKLSQKIYILK